MEASQNICVVRNLDSKCGRDYLMANLEFDSVAQKCVCLFSMPFNIARHSDDEFPVKHGFNSSSLPWVEISGGFRESVEEEVKSYPSLLDLLEILSNSKFHMLSTSPFSKNILIQYLGEDMQLDVYLINFPQDSGNYLTERAEVGLF
ncbi:unnamed protein product [Clonostachys rosea]|uniref:Uncharacterized protein n=1 Tax=Bionectria ochroleuca TaxID=29856 RepID=A0ABY6UNI5_BIOOC|nr:unnamed protein product [Clonostachys rosea]